MTRQGDRSNFIDQLEELKQGLNSILARHQDPQDSPKDLYSTSNQAADHSLKDDMKLLDYYEVLNTTKRVVGGDVDKDIEQQGNQSLMLLNQQYQIVAFNRGAESCIPRITGKALMYGSTIKDFIPDVDLEMVYETLKQTSGGVSVHFTCNLNFPQDQEQWYEINLFPVKASDGSIARIVWCMEDIAERKVAQANLKALEINFQSVFKQAAVSVILSNTNLEVIQANRKFYELIEYSPAEYKALPPLSITHPRDLAESKRLLRLLCDGEINSFSLEKRLITKTGKVIWVYLTTNIVKDPQGKPKLIISVAQDVTDRKHAEQELIFKSNELDTFIYRASHDLRGPVASLMGLYNVVQSEFEGQAHVLEYFKHYHQSVQRLNKILHNLIDLTKIKEKDLESSEVALDDIISDCLDSLKKSDYFEDIHFKIKNEVDFKLQSDTSSIKTILYHLLENAVNFVQFDHPQPFVKLEIKHDGSFLIIEVTDNGQGIKKEVQSEVFNMFYRANERSGGSGLGLYIVRYAVEKLNGSIQLKSKELSGTKISVYIPYSKSDSMANTRTDDPDPLTRAG